MMMMMSLNGKHAFALPHTSLPEPKYSSLHSSATAMRRACLPTPQLQSNIFGGLDESLLARAEALAAVDIVSPTKSHHHHHHHQHHPPHHSPFKPDATYHTMNALPCTSSSSSTSSSSVPITHPSALAGAGHHHHHHHHHHHQPHQALEGELLDHLTPGGLALAPDGSMVSAAPAAHMAAAGVSHMHQAAAAIGMAHAAHAHGLPSHAHALPPHAAGCMSDVDADPRDLEAFAERFKQRRIKLGVTQADVGAALASLKIPGVGSLSQSTICRFESLTLSHNNMIALKPILHAWLEEAEKSHREKLSKPELFNGAEKKRKRTSIAAPEKRSLEAYFAIQPRPSSEKIAAIAEKLDLKKNVVRVWFCNQRQKQKRMKYSACV
ncbi:POU domain, class 4, transcription factor 2 isoform X2 [Colossoma macropomum]|uniref:POU domain, class 4, transcription factor 2 isoform X2 n=1 Tax=Colossoma macropomum TaxID=42526 RepID=UPI0018650A1B|nr:POU domain, class 4, transcription factor 2 isoform X2 [Colossoma macropomum]